MGLVTTLGRTLGFSFAAGINLYATVALLGLAERFGWVTLPPQFEVFDSDVVIGVALGMYVVEFFADKIPWVDTAWDAVHTVVRPLGGALIAVVVLGDASPTIEGLIALLGGSVAAGTHLTKAGTRAVVNTSPEPVSNGVISLAEDVLAVGLGYLALSHPAAALVVVGLLLLVMLAFLGVIIRAARRRLFRRSPRGRSVARGLSGAGAATQSRDMCRRGYEYIDRQSADTVRHRKAESPRSSCRHRADRRAQAGTRSEQPLPRPLAEPREHRRQRPGRV